MNLGVFAACRKVPAQGDWAWAPDHMVTYLDFATEFFNDLTMLIVFGLMQVSSVVKAFARLCTPGAPQGERVAQLAAASLRLLQEGNDNARRKYAKQRARRSNECELDSLCARLLGEWAGSAPSTTAGGGGSLSALQAFVGLCQAQSEAWLELLSPTVPAESVPKRIQHILESVPVLARVAPGRLKWMQLQLMLTIQVGRSIEWSNTDLGVDDLFGGWRVPTLPEWQPSDFSAALFGRRDWCLLVPVLLEMWHNALRRCGVKGEELAANFVDEEFGGQRDKVMAYLQLGLATKLHDDDSDVE